MASAGSLRVNREHALNRQVKLLRCDVGLLFYVFLLFPSSALLSPPTKTLVRNHGPFYHLLIQATNWLLNLQVA